MKIFNDENDVINLSNKCFPQIFVSSRTLKNFIWPSSAFLFFISEFEIFNWNWFTRRDETSALVWMGIEMRMMWNIRDDADDDDECFQL